MTWYILFSIQSQHLNFLSTQHSNSKYAGFYTTLGLGHMFVSVQHTVTILTRNVISSPSQGSIKQICWVPVKIVQPTWHTQSQSPSPHEYGAQPTLRCSLHPEHALDCSPLWIRDFWLLHASIQPFHQYQSLCQLKPCLLGQMRVKLFRCQTTCKYKKILNLRWHKLERSILTVALHTKNTMFQKLGSKPISVSVTNRLYSSDHEYIVYCLVFLFLF